MEDRIVDVYVLQRYDIKQFDSTEGKFANLKQKHLQLLQQVDSQDQKIKELN